MNQKKTKAQHRADLLQYAEAELKEFGFVKGPETSSYQYIGQTKAGPIAVSIIPDEGRARNKPASISLMMCFDNVEAALKAGFTCNQFSGKYNWMFTADKDEIYRIIAGLMPEKTQDTPRHRIAQHTPGPWIVNSGQIYGEDGDTICMMQAMGYMDPMDDANAALIAASPDLLAALKSLIEDMAEAHADELATNHHGDGKGGCTYCQSMRAGYAAIAKAEGR